ncbi:cytochrome B5 [Clostridiales bacterium COT073_COT-073]|nr:cytochrome B5 [Clostridiales bacterium COT073_COT-073]
MKQEAATDAKSETKETAADEKVFTVEELAKYNGKDGAKAYVAIDGVVYDVTEVKAWKEGMHNGFEAGQDLTEAIQKAPHGTAKLEGLPVVGKLAK